MSSWYNRTISRSLCIKARMRWRSRRSESILLYFSAEISYEIVISQHADFAEIGVNHYAYVDIQVPDGVETIVLSTPKPVVRQENDFWPTMRSLTLVIGIIISTVAFYWPLTLTAIVIISLIILFRAHTKNNRKNYHQWIPSTPA